MTITEYTHLHKQTCFYSQINVMAYVRDLERAKQGQGGLPDRHSLTEAKADLERVLSVRPCLRTHLEMGQVGGDVCAALCCLTRHCKHFDSSHIGHVEISRVSERSTVTCQEKQNIY